mmetsp:Transcript_10703/g.25753  ORF Transcript_10703/g.25753 Transcript_10703/m.25753 type:complete len:330 (-) Transcript_10703:40-1029(-)
MKAFIVVLCSTIFGLMLGFLGCVSALTVRENTRVDYSQSGSFNLPSSSRRSFMSGASSLVSIFSAWSHSSANAVASQTKNDIANRLEENVIFLPQPSSASELNGIDNMYFPSYLSGEWEVNQTLVDMQAPLGLKYIGGPNGSLDIAKKTMNEARSKIGVPIQLKLRYIPTKWGVAEDRLFNNRERLNAFAEKSVVASVQYADVGGSNRKTVLALGGTNEDPLQTTIVYFKGPAAQKNFITSHGMERGSATQWTGFEVQRSIFALTNQNTSPPITTDSEYIWSFEQLDANHIRGKLRIASYLNAQSDTLYFDARNRAVSLQDYVLDMEKK